MIDERTFIFDVQSVIHWMSAIFFTLIYLITTIYKWDTTLDFWMYSQRVKTKSLGRFRRKQYP